MCLPEQCRRGAGLHLWLDKPSGCSLASAPGAALACLLQSTSPSKHFCPFPCVLATTARKPQHLRMSRTCLRPPTALQKRLVPQPYSCAIGLRAAPRRARRLQAVADSVWLAAKTNQRRESNKSGCWQTHTRYRRGAVAGTGFPRAASSSVFSTSRAPAQQAFCSPTEVTFHIQMCPLCFAARFVCPAGLQPTRSSLKPNLQLAFRLMGLC